MVPAYPKPPRPLKLPKHFNLLFAFFTTFVFWDYFLEPIWAMVTRPVEGLSSISEWCSSHNCSSKVVKRDPFPVGMDGKGTGESCNVVKASGASSSATGM